LEVIVEVLGDRKIAVAKDLTKLREDFYFGSVKEVLEELRNNGFEENPHGEFVVMVEGN
jgi:16S rRNA (cytidine1402-2'-O)-methyltransferase